MNPITLSVPTPRKGAIMNHPIRCPNCNSNLTTPGSIEVHLSSGSHEWDEQGQVDQSGTLSDPDGNVAKGLHAGSYCGYCGELLEERKEPEQQPSRFRVLTFNNGEPWVSDPFPNRELRDAHARQIFEGYTNFVKGEDNIGWLDQYDNGDINVGCYTGEDLEP